MRNPFEKFHEREIREKTIKEGHITPELELLKKYEEFMDLPGEEFPVYYRDMQLSLEGLRYGEKEVEEFINLLEGYKYFPDFTWKTGIFLGEVVNNMEGEEVEIYLKSLGMPINQLGYGLRKGRMIVHGSVGACLGHGMQGGEIIVHGDAGEYTGHCMRGGKITINGKAKSAGTFMEGGLIEVDEIENPKNSEWEAYRKGGEVRRRK